MSSPKHSRTRTNKLISVSIGVGLIAVIIGFFLYLLLPPGQPRNITILSATFFTLIGAILSVVGIVISTLQFTTLRISKRKSTKLGELREPTVTTSGISARFGPQPAEEASDELLSVERQRLELEKQKIQLEREQQTIGWQKEALAVVQMSPRSAIVIAWIGVEQELNRIARRPNLLFPSGTNIAQPFSTIKALYEADYINQHELETLKRMQELRNRVVHGIGESASGTEEAISYVQDAINVTQKLASIGG